MDYYKFLDEFDTYNEWNRIEKRQKKEEDMMWGHKDEEFDRSPFVAGIDSIQAATTVPAAASDDVIWLGESLFPKEEKKSDNVNSPSHYTSGKTEVIDIIEDAVKDAPSNIYGMLQGQVLKYMLRVWLKDNPLEDLKKAQWYLERLIKHYSNPPGDDNFPPGRWDSSLDDFR